MTGTAKNKVVVDYAKRLSEAIYSVQNWMGRKVGGKPCWKQASPREMWKQSCSGPLRVDPLADRISGTAADGPSSSERAPPTLRKMVYHVRKGGAYLFLPEKNSARLYSGSESMWKQTIQKVGPNVWDYTFDFHLTKNNQEWFVRFETGIKNDGKFVTDLNGFNFETHVHRKDLPTQAQVYPMPGYASIEDSSNRLTVLSTHAQGAASLVTGSLDIWIDRRLAQDDERGLGQGVQDNVRMTTTLRVILEDVRGTAPSHWVRRWWEDLEHLLSSLLATLLQVCPFP